MVAVNVVMSVPATIFAGTQGVSVGPVLMVRGGQVELARPKSSETEPVNKSVSFNSIDTAMNRIQLKLS